MYYVPVDSQHSIAVAEHMGHLDHMYNTPEYGHLAVTAPDGHRLRQPSDAGTRCMAGWWHDHPVAQRQADQRARLAGTSAQCGGAVGQNKGHGTAGGEKGEEEGQGREED